jgi:hypothetical protein
MLKILLILPLIGCLPLIAIKTDDNVEGTIPTTLTNNKNSLMKNIALSFSLLNLLVSIVV